MDFEIIGEIDDIEVIAVANSIDDVARLRKQFGAGRCRKLKGVASVRLEGGEICVAEIHWYEAHGVGKRKMKIKQVLNK